MAQLSPEQQQVLSRILKIGRQKGASPKEIKAAVETGLVETRLRNLKGGDADSAGWRQERASLYSNPTNLNASIGRFFDETAAVKNKYARAGELAAAVQRPAAQYRGRYQDQSGQAQALLAGLGQGGVSSPGTGTTTTRTTTIPGVDNSQQRLALTAAYLANTHDPNALTALAAGLLGAKNTAAQTVTSSKTTKTGGKSSVSGDPLLSAIQGRASAIDAKHMPYQWGGGHQADVKPGQPLDCSGAVSRVLGVKAKVASDFKSWGNPGKGSNVTVYAKDTHVLMSIRGKDGKEHFWGTSQANPGGGAGWIPKSQISDEYLSGFVARHPAGQ